MKKISSLALSLLFCLTLSSQEGKEQNLNSVYNYNIETGIFGNRIKVSAGNMRKIKTSEKEKISVDILYNSVNYEFIKENDSVYVENLSIPEEKYFYRKRNGYWKLIDYEASGKEREYKANLEGKFRTKAMPLVEVSKEQFNSGKKDTVNFFLFGEEYYFYKTREVDNKTSEYNIGGIKREEGDKILFSKKAYATFSDKSDLPYKFRSSFDIEGRGLLDGSYTIVGKKAK